MEKYSNYQRINPRTTNTLINIVAITNFKCNFSFNHTLDINIAKIGAIEKIKLVVTTPTVSNDQNKSTFSTTINTLMKTNL